MLRAACLLAVAAGFFDAIPAAERFSPRDPRLTCTLKAGRYTVHGITFSKSGKRMATIAQDGTVVVWDLSTRKALRTFDKAFFFEDPVGMTPDGSKLVGISADRKGLRILDVDHGTEGKSIRGVFVYKGTVALSPDGRRVAVTMGDRSVSLHDVATGAKQVELQPSGSEAAGGLAWSPDGKTVIMSAWDGQLRAFDSATGTVKFQTEERPQAYGVPIFAPDGATFAVVGMSDRKARIFETATGREVVGFEPVMAGHRCFEFLSGGRLTALGEATGVVIVADRATGKEVSRFKASSSVCTAVKASPDGRWLAVACGSGQVQLWGGHGRGPEKAPPMREGRPGFLGISASLDDEDEDGTGVKVGEIIPGGGAEKAGLLAGDVILKINGADTLTFDVLRSTISSLREGDDIEIVYKRGAEERKAKAKLGAREE